MKKKLMKCDFCEEETNHSVKKVMSSKRMKPRRFIDKCNECGKTIIKNSKNGTYTKKSGGNK